MDADPWPGGAARQTAGLDASLLLEHEVLVRGEWVKPGALLQPYGAVLSVDPRLPISVDKNVLDEKGLGTPLTCYKRPQEM